MAHILRFRHGAAMAVVEVSALAFVESAEPILAEIEEKTREHGDRRLLVNLLDVVGTLEPEDHQAIGALAGTHLAHLERVAALVPADKLTGAGEVAAADGRQWKIFTSLTAAVHWLMG